MTDNQSLALTVAAVTHTGNVREINEDSILVDTWAGTEGMAVLHLNVAPFKRKMVVAVADGMGGHACGEHASCHTVLRLSESVLNGTPLNEIMTTINGELYEIMAREPEKTGMGSTVAGVILETGNATVFNVGDSKVFRIDAGFLRQLSRDDSPFQDSFGSESASSGGLITQALGGHSQLTPVSPHIEEYPLHPGDLFLICSDGLTDMVSLDGIEGRLGDDLRESAQSLLDAALQAGGNDNISIILVKIGESHG